MESDNQYKSFETILKNTFPGVMIFQANMPFVKMDELARAEVKTVTYLFYQDTERILSDGPSGVHDVIIEINIFGKLDEIDSMTAALNAKLLSDDVTAGNWTFTLAVKDKKDIWEPGIKSKRLWIQYKGLMIQEGE